MNHLPYVPKLYGHFDNYLVMELIDGLSLYNHTDSHNSWNYNWILLRRLLLSIRQLHFDGFCHRDIKADNIMITPSQSIYLIDLQLCSRVSAVLNIYEYIYPDDDYINDDNGYDRYQLLQQCKANNIDGIIIEYDRIKKLEF